MYDSPAVHPRISDEERFYIESKLGVNAISEIEKTIPGTKNQVTQALIQDHERNIGHETYDSDEVDDESKTQKGKQGDLNLSQTNHFKQNVNDGAASDVDEVHVLHSPSSPKNHYSALNSATGREKNVELKKVENIVYYYNSK